MALAAAVASALAIASASAALTVNVNFDYTVFNRTDLVGPAGGAGETWNQTMLGTHPSATWSGASVLDSAGNATGIDWVVSNADGGLLYRWVGSDLATLSMLDHGIFTNLGSATILTVTGLDPARTYDLYITGYGGTTDPWNGTTNYANKMAISTSNITTTSIPQQMLQTGETASWVLNDNYVVFEEMVPDASGNLAISGVKLSSYGFWSGFQLVETSPLVPAPDIRLTITPNAGTPGNYDFEWDSRAGKVYDLVSDTGLATTPDTWPVWQGHENVPASGTGITGLTDIPGGGDTRRFFAVIEKIPPPLLSADFETSNGGFTSVNKGTGTEWTWGAPISPSQGGGAVTVGNGGSAKCWGTDIGNPGGYLAGTDTCLRSPVIDLSNVASATLSFAQALDIQSPHTLVVNVIEATSDTVLQAAVHSSTPDPDTSKADWKAVSGIAISGGQPVRIEWHFVGDGDGSYLGAYIDDVVVTAP